MLIATDTPVKQCLHCSQVLPLDYFWPSYDKRYDKTRHRNYCRDCGGKYNKTRHSNGALESQKRSCAICHEPLPKVWHLDHNHDTGQVRGILCPGCNAAIGHIRENTNSLRSAITYLDYWNGGDC